MWSATAVFYGVVTGFVIFLALEKVWGWIKALTTKPAPPPPPPERTLTTKDLEDILDMFIQYQGSVVTDARTVEAAPVAVKEEEHNGHRELTEDDVLANLNPAPVTVADPPRGEVVKKKKGKK